MSEIGDIIRATTIPVLGDVRPVAAQMRPWSQSAFEATTNLQEQIDALPNQLIINLASRADAFVVDSTLAIYDQAQCSFS